MVFVPALLQEVIAHVDLLGPEEPLVKVLGVVRGHGDHALQPNGQSVGVAVERVAQFYICIRATQVQGFQY